MWGAIYNNRKCNDHERFMQHKSHIQRIFGSKSTLDNKQPKKPNFLFRITKKEEEQQGIYPNVNEMK